MTVIPPRPRRSESARKSIRDTGTLSPMRYACSYARRTRLTASTVCESGDQDHGQCYSAPRPVTSFRTCRPRESPTSANLFRFIAISFSFVSSVRRYRVVRRRNLARGGIAFGVIGVIGPYHSTASPYTLL